MNEKCPYCGKDMLMGELNGDGRSSVRFESENDKLSFLDRMVTEKGEVTSAKHTYMGKFHIPALYCEYCEKIIIDAKVKKY